MSDQTTTPVDAETTQPAETGTDDGISWKMLISGGGMGLLIGAIAAWATANMGLSLFAFLIAGGGSAYYLYQKPIPSIAVGTGLYFLSGTLVMTPILFYLPTVFSSSEGQSAAAAGSFIGSILGLLIWGFVFLIIGLVLFVLGYFLNKRGKKKLDAA